MIHSLVAGGRQGIIVENLAKLIHDAGFKLVAEGIETKEALELVTSLGFTHGQGYYLGRPAKLGQEGDSWHMDLEACIKLLVHTHNTMPSMLKRFYWSKNDGNSPYTHCRRL